MKEMVEVEQQAWGPTLGSYVQRYSLFSCLHGYMKFRKIEHAGQKNQKASSYSLISEP